MRYLVHIRMTVDNSNVWTMKPISGKEDKQFSFKASDDMVRKLLFNIKATDDIVEPRSKKALTYQQIIDEIKSDRDNMIYVWSEKYPKSLEQVKELMK